MNGVPEDLFLIAWMPWAFLCAWVPRYLAVRKWRETYGLGAYFIGYFSWPLLFVIGIIIAGWTGMQMYGFDRSNPWHLTGWVVLFLTPFGLPLLYGAPLVLILDLSRFALRRLKPASPLANPNAPRED